MPTYEYECDACGHAFEQFQMMSDKPLKKCPVCNKRKLQRLIGSGAGIIFKGSGFYETDYKRSGSGKSAKSENASSGGESKSDSSASSSSSSSSDSASKSAKSSTTTAGAKD
ncbi:MAG: FmdB family zinc ribbon protein [Planctomycetota bacterium]